jgi:type IV pilus assembly protein PilM
LAGSLIGIEVGSNTMKAAEATGGPGALHVHRLAWCRTPDDAYVEGVIIDPVRLGQALGDLISSNGFSSRKAAVALSGTKNCALRVHPFPRMNDKELKANLKLEADRLLPFPPNEDVQWAHQVLDTGGQAETMDVLVAGARKDHVRSWCDALRHAKLQPVSFDMEAVAQLIALVEAPREYRRERCLLLIDIGQTATNVSIVEDGLLRFVRSVDIAGDKLTQAVHLELKPDTRDEAEQYKLQYGNVSLIAHEHEMGGDEGDFLADQLLSSSMAVGARPEDEDMVITIGGPAERATAGSDDTLVLDGGGSALFGDLGLGDPSKSDDFMAHGADDGPGAMPSFEDEPLAAGPAPMLEMEDEPAHVASFDFVPDDTPEFADDGFAPAGGGIVDDEAYAANAVGGALIEPLANLVSEVRRSLEYYRSRHQDTAVERILLIGGSSRIRNIAEFFQRELDIPTEIGDPFATLGVDANLYPAATLQDMRVCFAGAMGMALRDLI